MDDSNGLASPEGQRAPRAASVAGPTRASDRPPALTTGAVLAGRYRVTGTIELDHVAARYRARALDSERELVIKVFHEIGRDDQGRIEHVRRASPLRVGRLELPGCFAAVEACGFTDDNRLFLAMEAVDDPSLAELLARPDRLPPDRSLELATEVGEAVEVALNLGLLDVRIAPDDIAVVNGGERVRLLRSDLPVLRRLGLADQLLAAEAPSRDPRYVSPEERAGLPATERSVVYGLGVLLHDLVRAAPPSVRRLIGRMQSSDPRARPADLAAILNQIWDARCQLPAETAVALPATRRTPRIVTGALTRRRGAVVTLFVLAAGGALLGWPHLAEHPRNPRPVPTSGQPDVQATPAPLPRSAPDSAPSAASSTGVRVTTETVPSATSPARLPSSEEKRSTPPPDLERTAMPRVPSSGERGPSAPDAGSTRVTGMAAPEGTPLQVSPEPATERSARAPNAPVRPPLRPSEPRAPEGAASDPGAIIDWLVREAPRVGE